MGILDLQTIFHTLIKICTFRIASLNSQAEEDGGGGERSDERDRFPIFHTIEHFSILFVVFSHNLAF